MNEDVQALKRELRWHKWLLLGLLAVMWGVEVANTLTGHALNQFGLHPRSLPGLLGIATMPFLHGGFPHLISNTIGWLIFGWMILLIDVREFIVVFVLSALIGGLGTWILGAPESTHVGASGVIFGFFGFLLLRGWYRRSFWSILLSLFIGTTFGVMIFGVLPGQTGISWECHLFGFIGGVLAARILHKKKK